MTKKSIPPGWKTGARYKSTFGRFKAPRRKLPEPKSEPDNRSLIPGGLTWSEDAEAAEIEVGRTFEMADGSICIIHLDLHLGFQTCVNPLHRYLQLALSDSLLPLERDRL